MPMLSAERLLPHEPPMLLLDAVHAYDDGSLSATASVSAGSPFVSGLGMRACFGLEVMAQAAAAFFTLRAGSDAPPRQGMLIASRRFQTSLSHYPLDSVLLVQVTLASALPADDVGRALVKFDGAITVLEGDQPLPSNSLHLDNATEASLSVYL
jgi:predicted hotdog family 3-hydroxylacyl-ACP dehydratase